jgi:RNase P subunit RPR2
MHPDYLSNPVTEVMSTLGETFYLTVNYVKSVTEIESLLRQTLKATMKQTTAKLCFSSLQFQGANYPVTTNALLHQHFTVMLEHNTSTF